MIKTIYTCDKCNKEQYTADQFWKVGVVARPNNNEITPYQTPVKSIQVCRLCLESFGIHVQKKEGVKPSPSPPTIEKRILSAARP